MRLIPFAFAALLLSPAGAQTPVTHFPARGATPPGATAGGPGPAFSGAVMAGDTLYVSGTTDNDPATGKPPPDVKGGARLVMATSRLRSSAPG